MGGFLAFGSVLFFLALFLGGIYLVLWVALRIAYAVVFVAVFVGYVVSHWRETWMYQGWVAWKNAHGRRNGGAREGSRRRRDPPR